MRRWLCAAFLMVTAVFIGACTGQPQIVVTEETLILGDVVNGEVVTREVTVHNKGQSDLVIQGLSTSCGCTQATLSSMKIPAGGNGILTIKFDSGAHGPDLTGPIVRQIFISSNDSQQPEIIVELAANILPSVEL